MAHLAGAYPIFISIKHTNKPVTSTILVHLLQTFLRVSGIDSQTFKAHMYGASRTAAANAFMPLWTIMMMADWSSVSTLGTFYYKLLFNSDFATGVLSS